MDTVDAIRSIIESILIEYTKIPYAYGDFQTRSRLRSDPRSLCPDERRLGRQEAGPWKPGPYRHHRRKAVDPARRPGARRRHGTASRLAFPKTGSCWPSSRSRCVASSRVRRRVGTAGAGHRGRRETMPRPVPALAQAAPRARAGTAAHRYGWLAYDYLERRRRIGRFEHCAVCGRFRPMLYRRRVIPRRLEELWGLSPRLAEALARKESCDCAACGAKLRCRRIARVVLALYPVGDPPAPARSLADWVESPGEPALRVAEINRIDGVHDSPRVACRISPAPTISPAPRRASSSTASARRT